MAEHRVTISGDLDLSQVAQLRDELQRLVADTEAHVLVDCAQLSFVDSTGIAVLLEAHDALKTQRRRMLIANVPARLRRTFELLGVSNLLTNDRVPAHCRRPNGRPMRAPIM